MKKTLAIIALSAVALTGLTACDNSKKNCDGSQQSLYVPDSVAEKGGGGGGGGHSSGGGGGHSSGSSGSSSAGHSSGSSAGESSSGSAGKSGSTTSSGGSSTPFVFPFFGGGSKSGGTCGG